MFGRIIRLIMMVALLAGASACTFPLPGPSNPQPTQAPADQTLPAEVTAAPGVTEAAVTQPAGEGTAAPVTTESPAAPTTPSAEVTLPPLATTAPAQETATTPGVQPTLKPASTETGQGAGEAGGGLAVPQKYTLQRGEYPVCIAQRFNVDPVELMRLNNLQWWQIFFSGTILKLPQGGQPYPGDRSLHDHPAVHTVRYGENLYSIACYYGDVAPEAIAQTNGLSAPYSLRIGQKLNIP